MMRTGKGFLKSSWTIFLHSYVLMGSHYHLILETPQGNLLKGMHEINGRYTGFLHSHCPGSSMKFKGNIHCKKTRMIPRRTSRSPPPGAAPTPALEREGRAQLRQGMIKYKHNKEKEKSTQKT